MNSELKLNRRDVLGLMPLVGLSAPNGLHDWGAAADFKGISQWFNSAPLSMAQLRGQVVLIDFWTHACINCLRTLPYVNRWAATYREKGLVVVGVHTPEFAFERSVANVKTAIQRHGVKHPVAMDNDYMTWKAYNNRFWPAHYLVDGQGRVRYRHFGEGEYERTEAAIRTLLSSPSRV
jgi:thiol-disulfide isomerase/thioredoxin